MALNPSQFHWPRHLGGLVKGPTLLARQYSHSEYEKYHQNLLKNAQMSVPCSRIFLISKPFLCQKSLNYSLQILLSVLEVVVHIHIVIPLLVFVSEDERRWAIRTRCQRDSDRLFRIPAQQTRRHILRCSLRHYNFSPPDIPLHPSSLVLHPLHPRWHL